MESEMTREGGEGSKSDRRLAWFAVGALALAGFLGPASDILSRSLGSLGYVITFGSLAWLLTRFPKRFRARWPIVAMCLGVLGLIGSFVREALGQ